MVGIILAAKQISLYYKDNFGAGRRQKERYNDSMIQMGKLLQQLRKEQHLTLTDLENEFMSRSVLSRIENEQRTPDIFQLAALLHRFGKSMEYFEIVVSGTEYNLLCLREKLRNCLMAEEFEGAEAYLKEYEQNVKNSKKLHQQYAEVIRRAIREKNPHPVLPIPNLDVLVVSEAALLKDIRKSKGMSQEQFSDNLCARETISYIENGRTPNHKKLEELLEKRGISWTNYYGFVVATEFEVYELVQEYQRVIDADRNIATSLLQDIRQRIDVSHPVNRQFLEGSELLDKLSREELGPAEAMAGLEKCLRYTMPDYDGSLPRIPYREEVVLLEGIVQCLKLLERSEPAMELAETLAKKLGKKSKFS